MLAIIAAFAAASWIVLDVAMTLFTAPPTMPLSQWRAIVYGGGGVALFTVAAGIYEYFHTKKQERIRAGEMTDLRERLIKQDGMLTGMGISFSQAREVLIAKSSAGPADVAVKATLAEVESKLWQILWKPLGSEEKAVLTSKLRALGVHTVQISSHEATDCVGLALDIKHCFEAAEWKVRKWPLTAGVLFRPGDNGVTITAKGQLDVLFRVVRDALLEAIRAPIFGMMDTRPAPDQEWAELRIHVNPKRGDDF